MADEQVLPEKPYSAEDPVVAEIVRRLVDVYRPERIYLFGSVARGEADADSDYDFMVIVGDDTSPELRNPGRGYRATWRLGAAADIHVYRATYFDRQLHLKASLPAEVIREGRLLYAG